MAAQISTHHPAERTTALPLVRTNAGVLSVVPAWLSLALVPCVVLAPDIDMGLRTALLWLGQDVPALLAGQVPGDTEAGLLTNPIHVLDLGLVLPAAVLTGVLLARRRAWGWALGAYFLVKFTTWGWQSCR